jgi:hypothetical protein
MATLRKVKHQSKMDAETFLKHINARHVPIGKMPHVGKSNIPGDEDESLLRAYHDAVHRAHDGAEPSIYSNETVPNHIHGEASE